MKRIFLLITLLILMSAVWYGESRAFVSLPKLGHFTVWKTYNNKCYIIAGKYYGLFKPSSDYTYIETVNTSLGVDLIWKNRSDTILAQADSGTLFHNNASNKFRFLDYKLDKLFNDSTFTYFDRKLRVKRYKKTTNIISIPINKMGAL